MQFSGKKKKGRVNQRGLKKEVLLEFVGFNKGLKS